MKKKNILPILLIAGAAVAFMAFRRRPRVTVSAETPIKQTAEEYQASYQAAQPSLLDKAADVIKNVFSKPPQTKAAAQAQRAAVKRAVRTKTATRKQAKAVTKSLSQGIRIKGFTDDSVLC